MAETGKSPALRLAILVLVTFVAIGVTATVFALPNIVERAAVRVLKGQGIDAAELTVEEIGWQRLRLSHIRIGTDGPLTVDSVTVDYTPLDIFARSVGEVRVQGLRLTARFDGNGISLGSIDPLLKGGGGQEIWTVGAVDLRDIQLTIEAPFADLAAKMDGHAAHRRGDEYEGTLGLVIAVAPKNLPRFDISGAIAFEGSAKAPALLTVDLSAQAPPIPIINARQASLHVQLDKGGTQLLAAVDATEGKIRLDADGPPLTSQSDNLAARGTLSFDLGGLMVPGFAKGLSVVGALDLSYDGKVLNVNTRAPVAATLATLIPGDLQATARQWVKFPISLQLEQVKLNTDLGSADPQLGGRASFSIAAADGQALKGTLAGSAAMDANGNLLANEPIRIAASYKARTLAFAETTLAAPSITAAGSFRTMPDSMTLSLEKPLVLSAEKIVSKAGPAIATSVRVEAAQDGAPFLTIKRAGTDGGGAKLRARLSIPKTSLQVGDLPATIRFPMIRVEGALAATDNKITLSVDTLKGRVVLPKHAVSVQGIEASIDVARSTTVKLRSAVLQHTGVPPQFAPLVASGQAIVDETRIKFSGRVGDRVGRLVVDLSGTHETASGSGMTRVKLHPLVFQPGAFQPRDLLPALGRNVSAASGRIEAGGTITWFPKRLSSDLRLTLAELAFTAYSIQVEKVNTALAIDRPWPLSSPPGQRLTIDRVTAGIPFDNISTTFQIDPKGPLRVDRGAVDLLGGRIEIGGVVVDPQSPHVETVLMVNGVSVTEIMTIADIDGASGTGRLRGHIPVRFANGILDVRNGILETESPGVLRYKPAVPPPALQGGGEQISLVRGALENFHYKTLRLELNGQTGGEWTTKMHLNGKNPDFMEGYPFEFNLNLSGKLDEIVRNGLESYQHPERLGKGARPPAH